MTHYYSLSHIPPTSHTSQSDFDKHLERAEAVKTVTTSPSSIPAAAAPRGNLNGPDVLQEASLLYKKQDLSLKDGQTIKYVCVLGVVHDGVVVACDCQNGTHSL